MVRKNEAGVLTSQSETSFSDGIIKLLQDDGQLARLGHAARRMAIEELSFKKFTPIIESIYLRALSKSKERVESL